MKRRTCDSCRRYPGDGDSADGGVRDIESAIDDHFNLNLSTPKAYDADTTFSPIATLQEFRPDNLLR